MLTKAERFADMRKCRWGDVSWMSARIYRDMRGAYKSSAKHYAKHYMDARKDKRWAMGALIQFESSEIRHACFARFFHVANSELRDAARGFGMDNCIPAELAHRYAAHRSLTDPSKIACYPTIADMRRQREVVMSAGKFFAATMPSCTPAEVQEMAERFIERGKPVEIQWAETANEWVWVYKNGSGFRSCMTDFADEEEHPVRFYAYPNNGLKLAYLKCRDKVAARCIVNVEKKLYVRVYGDARLALALDAAGYTSDPTKALSGVKCAALDTGYGLIAPYLDGCCDMVQWDGETDYCTIDDDGNWETGTSGTATMVDTRPICDNCGDRMGEYEENYSESENATYCDSCALRHWVYATVNIAGATDYVRNSSAVLICDEHYVEDDALLEALGFVYDQGEGEWVVKEVEQEEA